MQRALPLIEGGRVALSVVEDLRIDAKVRDPQFRNGAGSPSYAVGVEWSSGTGPQALRVVCSCGGSGVCEHVVATLESVRTQTEFTDTPADDGDLAWLPAPRAVTGQPRARCVWPVFSSADGATLSVALLLDSPRLRGAVRDAGSIATMMETSPLDDWDEADRELLRDEAVVEALSGRPSQKMLARALFRLARHPRLRFDAHPKVGRHPSELPEFSIDLRGLQLRATRSASGFSPVLAQADGKRIELDEALVLDGPPPWLATREVAYLLDGSFDVRRVLAARSGAAASLAPSEHLPSARAITMVAAYLSDADRAALGVVDAQAPTAEVSFAWTSGALVANLTFVDPPTGARTPFALLGAIAPLGDRYVRFTRETAERLRDRFLAAGFVPRAGERFALYGVDRAADFVRQDLARWNDLECRLDDGLLEFARGDARLDIAVRADRIAEGTDWFELAVDAMLGDGQTLTREELAAILTSTGRYADVRGRLVDVARIRERSALLADLAERRRSGLAALLALRDELHDNFANVSLPPQVEALRERLRAFSGIEPVIAPSLHDGALRAYQHRGLEFLSYLASFGFGGILADDMGTGKTIITIAYLLRRKLDDGPKPSLVIAPTSVTHMWENEIARFAPELKTLRLRSGSDRAAHYENVAGADVVITSYALARLDAEMLAKHHFRTLILDEAQSAKNPSSQIARVVRALRADHRLALTGTPVENSLRDLWAIFAFAEPDLLGSETAFRRRFETPIGENDPKAIASLRSRLEPFVLRRTKEDVAPELPARTEVELECDLSPLQRRLYRGVAEVARREVFGFIDAGELDRASVHVLAALTRLRQICAHPGLLFEEHRSDPEASAKFEALLETLDEILSGGHRVLVFSAFASMLRIIRAELGRRGIEYCYLDGSTKDHDRQGQVEHFMRADGPPVFLCSLKAGGVGLTLTAADYVILYDPWWNPAVERQAIDRTHRIGQQRAVTAYRLLTRGTVEEKIRALAQRKMDLSRSVIKADGALAKSLTREDLEALLADPE